MFSKDINFFTTCSASFLFGRTRGAQALSFSTLQIFTFCHRWRIRAELKLCFFQSRHRRSSQEIRNGTQRNFGFRASDFQEERANKLTSVLHRFEREDDCSEAKFSKPAICDETFEGQGSSGRIGGRVLTRSSGWT